MKIAIILGFARIVNNKKRLIRLEKDFIVYRYN